MIFYSLAVCVICFSTELVSGSVEVIKKPSDVISKANSQVLINCTVEGMTNKDNLLWWRHTVAGIEQIFESNPSSQQQQEAQSKNTGNSDNSNNNGGRDSADISYKIEGNDNNNKNNGGDSGNPSSKSGKKFEVVGHYNLLVRDLQAGDGGVYWCEVGTHNYTAQVTVVGECRNVL